MPSSSGLIIYDPRVVADGREHFDPWWVMLECEPGIFDSARASLGQAGIRLSRPLWGSHVSIVSGEPPPHEERWRTRHGERVAFDYELAARTEGGFYWLDIACNELLDLRETLGLLRSPRRPFHLTLGRVKETKHAPT